MSDELHVSVADGVALLTIDRPAANNSMGGSLLRDFLAVTEELEADERVRVVVMTANVTSGATAWCPGVDLGQITGWFGPGADADEIFYEVLMQGDYAALGMSREGRRFDSLGCGRWTLQMLNNLRKPTIAAINGAVAGGGLGLLSLNLYRIAGESAKFKAAFSTVGAGPDLGASWFIPRLVGYSASVDFLLRDQAIDARQAHSIGLINQVVPDDQVLERSLEVAADLATRPPLALRALVRALRATWDNTLVQQLALEWDNQRVTFASADASKAVDAMVTRRSASQLGR